MRVTVHLPRHALTREQALPSAAPPQALAASDYVVEAVPEQEQLKMQIFRALDEARAPCAAWQQSSTPWRAAVARRASLTARSAAGNARACHPGQQHQLNVHHAPGGGHAQATPGATRRPHLLATKCIGARLPTSLVSCSTPGGGPTLHEPGAADGAGGVGAGHADQRCHL